MHGGHGHGIIDRLFRNKDMIWTGRWTGSGTYGQGTRKPNEKLKLPLSIGEWCDKLSEYSNQVVVEQ